MDFQSQYMTDKSSTGLADRETQQAIEKQYNDQVFDSPESWLVAE